ncbi:MAG: GNAT family N-acetyltransferase [Candidatus Hodarchaeales archaeon]|jgi:ribosomal protein S18 acetylase RimI-like enzyme
MFGFQRISISLDPPIFLRQAIISDLDFIKDVSHSEMDKIVPNFWSWRSWFDDLENDIMKNSKKVFVIQVNEESGGFLWVNEERNSLWITAIVLKEKFQRRRIGRKMMEFLIEESRKEGKEYVELGVQHNNPQALKFYSKFGFKQFDYLRTANTDLIRLQVKNFRSDIHS